jgi:hypothetical protein
MKVEGIYHPRVIAVHPEARLDVAVVQAGAVAAQRLRAARATAPIAGARVSLSAMVTTIEVA